MFDDVWGDFKETIRTVVWAVLIAVVVRTVAYEPFQIPSSSMYPTLMVGDYLFVSKMSYGYSKYSAPFSPPLFEGRIFNGDAPERGDVAVFRLPSNPSIDYIKRVIGLPGDTVQVRLGRLYINGELVERTRVEDYLMPDQQGGIKRIAQYDETLPGGVTHRILEERGDFFAADNTGVYTVPAGHYFMMGDNRDNSKDSRAIGFIPAENLIGRAEVLFFSTEGAAWQFWRWPFDIRGDRLLQEVS